MVIWRCMLVRYQEITSVLVTFKTDPLVRQVFYDHLSARVYFGLHAIWSSTVYFLFVSRLKLGERSKCM